MNDDFVNADSDNVKGNINYKIGWITADHSYQRFEGHALGKFCSAVSFVASRGVRILVAFQ